MLSIVETVNYLGLIFFSLSSRCQECVCLGNQNVLWCSSAQFGYCGLITIIFSISLETIDHSLTIASVVSLSLSLFLFFFWWGVGIGILRDNFPSAGDLI